MERITTDKPFESFFCEGEQRNKSINWWGKCRESIYKMGDMGACLYAGGSGPVMKENFSESGALEKEKVSNTLKSVGRIVWVL